MDLSQPAICLQLLSKLHATDVPRTHAALTSMVDALLAAAPAPNQHLEVLENAREAIAACQEVVAERYSNLPLPPDSDENRSLQQVVHLWRQLSRSYAQIARDDAGLGTLEDQYALLYQRRLHYSGLVLLEYFRARREVPLGCWAEIHGCFADARTRQLHKIRVADPLNEVWRAQSTHEAYVSILLAELGNPYSRSERELKWVIRWAQRFAPYCELHEPGEHSKPAEYGLDLHSDAGLRPLGLLPQSPTRLRFDGSTLASQIQGILTQFKRGAKPASLGLGKDCSTDASARLLLSLYRPWGHGTAGRRFPRRSTLGELGLSGNWLAIGYALDGVVFHQPRSDGSQRQLRDDMSLLTFGARVLEVDTTEQIQARHQNEAERLGLEFETWQVLDQSVAGYRIQRQHEGERLTHHQLIGVRSPDDERPLLGDLTRLMYYEDGRLEAGIEIFPGNPHIAAVRQLGGESKSAPYQQAFIAPAAKALDQAASIVLPANWYKPNKELEVIDNEQVRTIRLVRLVKRGANYDQCEFADAAAAS